MAYQTSRRLRFGDCDPTGFAYFPSYLDILIGVTEDFFIDAGVSWKMLLDEYDIVTPTVRLDLTFMHPGYYGAMLDFNLRVRKLGRSSLDLEHDISTGGTPLWQARHRLVAMSRATGKSCTWPKNARASLSLYLENDTNA
ncbi:acyl-CoA thioesterase [Acetobacter sp. TBRC 12305]|uniref:Acyl-CoA thioesterase n=1 Tax=Acetobacter garciniae TaxID=2817435 RepID=A0A939HIJ7_9PROT|nr:thioesterase family protein [Acetobacter garciniae]MBO1325078.1 acyl-CoA thioesterase [Acetobacter garciniae]MBX0344951.1 acyl-CoA thioesterase [Acetobacter garciniae]